jgi:4-amino-4-deoxy-L-arabinose transferase-like glycosyltransferase
LFGLIFGLAIVVRFVGIRFPFGDYDEGVYLATVRSVVHGFPLISQTYNSQGPLFIYIAELFYRVSPTLVSVRLFPIVSSLVVIWVSYKLVDNFLNRWAACFVALYLALDSAFLIVSRTFQVDMPWVALSVLSFYWLLQWHRHGKLRDVILSAVFFALSLFLKVNPLFVPMIFAYFSLRIVTKNINQLKYLLLYSVIPFILLPFFVPFHALGAFYSNTIHVRTSHVGFYALNWFFR